ncbi:MAG: hypothetical protein FWC09_01760 [Lachnospiraceae bacterium]|nr:hypothetical protein [Lachnospiraceae bacterium]
MRKMQFLLIEDDKQCRCEFNDYISSQKIMASDYPLDLIIADGEAEGLLLVQQIPFEAIILELELSESDGDGLIFLEKLKQLNLPNKPYIVVSSNNRSPIIKEATRNLGADFYKKKPDYSPEMVLNHILTIYQSGIDNVISIKMEKTALADEIKVLVSNIGLTDNLIGKKYVIEAILIVIENNGSDIVLHKDVFPLIARRHNKSVSSINRAIESVINKAWSIGLGEIRQQFYKAAVSDSKGKPTNKEFIFTLAQQIKDANNLNA